RDRARRVASAPAHRPAPHRRLFGRSPLLRHALRRGRVAPGEARPRRRAVDWRCRANSEGCCGRASVRPHARCRTPGREAREHPHRPSVPGALGALIMRCLEKHPADRWETADELLHQLEAMATPSGGMTPTGAGAPISSGTAAAIQRAHPMRVAALFGTASLGVLGLVYTLMLKLGLPDWVFAGAVALLVVGLPIMLLTGVFERRRALARTTGVLVLTPRGLPRWFTWRRSLLGGVVAFSGLGVATAGYMAMRLLGIGPVGTLVASGVLKQRERVVLANFQNRAADPTLAPSL